MQVAVLGAGAVGLSTAIRLFKEYPHQSFSVTVIAELTGDETTSRGAGGLWKPYSLADTPEADVLHWGEETFQYWLKLFGSTDAAAAGMQLVDAFQLWDKPTPDPVWKNVVPSFRHLTQKELDTFQGHAWRHGWKYTTLVCDSQKYMKYLMDLFSAVGGVLDRRKVDSLSELTGYDVVVNCLGLGAKELFNDKEMFPVRGQVIRVRAPWIKHYYNADGKFYIIPNLDTVVLGGTLNHNSWDTNISQQDKQNILEGCSRIIPSLKNAEVVADWAGLRPYRQRVRLEVEHKQVTGKTGKIIHLPIVHNYGHGGAGLTLHWGCAKDAAALVMQLMRQLQQQRQSKL